MVKYWKSTLSIVAMVANLATTAYADNHATNNEEVKGDNPVVLRINGKDVYKDELVFLQQGLADPWPQYDFQSILPSLQNLYAAMYLGEQYAVEQGLDQNNTFKNRLNLARTEILRNLAMENYIRTNLTDERVQALYDEQISQAEPQEERKLRHILVQNEEEAIKVIAELDAGADFSELAKKYSIGPSGDNGGELGWATGSDFVPSFAEGAWAIPVGEYGKTAIKSEYGFHVIIVDDSRTRMQAKFEDVKELLKIELAQMLELEFLTMLEQTATIERFDASGAALPEELDEANIEEVEEHEEGEVNAEETENTAG